MCQLQLSVAGALDAHDIAALHADSWRRNYRGAFADSYLDSEVFADRERVWSARLSANEHAVTVVAKIAARVVGFVHVVFDDDVRWGSLVDNLHVAHENRGKGIGTLLMRRAARAMLDMSTGRNMYLWVLMQNSAAQKFYRSIGGIFVEKAKAESPGGIPGRLVGSPEKLRYYWPDVRCLLGEAADLPQGYTIT